MRITGKTLEGMVEELNKAAGLPSAWTKTAKGSRSNPGSFVLDAAYGGYSLSMISTYGGGIHDVSGPGYTTGRELYQFMKGVLAAGMGPKSEIRKKITESMAYAEGEEERDAKRRAAQEAKLNA